MIGIQEYTDIPLVATSMLIEKHCAEISVLNLAKVSFSEICHWILDAALVSTLSELPLESVLLNLCMRCWKHVMDSRQFFAHSLVVRAKAFN